MSGLWTLLVTFVIELVLLPFAWRQKLEAERQARANGRAHRNRWPERAR
jgi:hypothetical protein